MSEKEKEIMQSFGEVLPQLPPEKMEYLLGFAEGIRAVAGGTANGKDRTDSDKI